MNVKGCVAIGTAVAVGWMLSGGYAQAMEYAQDQRGSGPSERAQVPGADGNIGSGTTSGGVGVGPSGQTSHGVPRTNGMDTMGEGSGHRDMRMPQQGMQSDPGRGGVPGPGSAGGTLGGGGNSLGSTSGGGSTGMGGSSGGGASGGGGK